MITTPARALILFFLVTGPQTAQAQRRAPEITQVSAARFTGNACPAGIIPSRECFRYEKSPLGERLATRRAPDHRYEGLGIGAGIGVAVGLLAGFTICHQSDVTCGELVPWTALGMGAIGGFVGLLVGAQFPKDAEEPAPRDTLSS